jgi:hypothetical protein
MVKKILLSTALLVSFSHADIIYQGTSVGAQAALFGLGASVKGKFNDRYGVRASFDTFSINDYEVEDDTTKYNFDLKLQDLMLVGTYHPWAGSFNVQAGMIVNNSVLDGDLTPNTRDQDKIEFDFNGKHYVYQVSELGAIETKVDFDPVAPYVGFGWDTSFDKERGFGFTFDLGVAYQGSANASYKLRYGEALDIEKATADIPDGPEKEAKIEEIKQRQQEIKDEIAADVDREMISLQEELDKYEWVPYIAIGFNYKF